MSRTFRRIVGTACAATALFVAVTGLVLAVDAPGERRTSDTTVQMLLDR